MPLGQHYLTLGEDESQTTNRARPMMNTALLSSVIHEAPTLRFIFSTHECQVVVGRIYDVLAAVAIVVAGRPVLSVDEPAIEGVCGRLEDVHRLVAGFPTG